MCGETRTETSPGTGGRAELLCGCSPEKCEGCDGWLDAPLVVECACGLPLCPECLAEHTDDSPELETHPCGCTCGVCACGDEPVAYRLTEKGVSAFRQPQRQE